MARSVVIASQKVSGIIGISSIPRKLFSIVIGLEDYLECQEKICENLAKRISIRRSSPSELRRRTNTVLRSLL